MCAWCAAGALDMCDYHNDYSVKPLETKRENRSKYSELR